MSSDAIIMMVLICGLVWGGFAGLLLRAAKYERQKGDGRTDDHSS